MPVEGDGEAETTVETDAKVVPEVTFEVDVKDVQAYYWNYRSIKNCVP